MRHDVIDPKLFVENRQRLKALLPPKSLVVVNANDIPPTNADGTLALPANSDLFYLSGIEQEESILLIAPNAVDEKMREILFLRETSDLIAVWEGHKHTKDEAKKITGIANVRWLSEFTGVFRALMMESEQVFLNTNEHARSTAEVETRDGRFIKSCKERYPLHTYRRLAPLMHSLRLVKSEIEIDLIKRACAITRDSYKRVAKFLKPGVTEYKVEAEFIHEYVRQRAQFAYGPIIAGGKNACVLHYVANDQPCKKGDLLLLDVAASYANYNSDVTRTIPVSGKFTRRQRQVYNSVLTVLRKCTAALTIGKTPCEWQKEAEAFTQEELLKLGLITKRDIKKQDPDKPALKKYFMHGVGHPLGLAVHDVINAGTPFAAGWVMTVEPGIYLPDENFAVRLEDDVLITEKGPVNLTADIPIEADDVEKLMR